MNKISLVGRLTKDPETNTTNSGIQYSKFNVACKSKIKDENGESKTDFFICVAWREKSKLVDEFLQKGDMVQVMGSMSSRSYEGQDGNQRLVWELVVEDMEFLTPKAEKQDTAKKSAKVKASQPELTPVDDDDTDNLPF